MFYRYKYYSSIVGIKLYYLYYRHELKRFLQELKFVAMLCLKCECYKIKHKDDASDHLISR